MPGFTALNENAPLLSVKTAAPVSVPLITSTRTPETPLLPSTVVPDSVNVGVGGGDGGNGGTSADCVTVLDPATSLYVTVTPIEEANP